MRRFWFSALCLTGFLWMTATLAQAQQNKELADLNKELGKAKKKLQDWPDLNRYRDANAQVPPPARNEKRVVFMGDSITDGWPLGQFFPGAPYLNRGISGQTTPQMLIRFRPDVLALKPFAVVILAGTNDIAGNTGPMPLSATQDNIASMAELAQAHGIRVVLASVLPVHDYGRRADGSQIIATVSRPPEVILALNAWLKDYARKNRHTYLDYYAAMVDDKGRLKAELADDGLHPNAQGYVIMQRLIQQVLPKP